MSDAYELVVIGGGTAGISAAQAAVTLGKRVLLVSDGPLGGECTWNGCVPSKALIEAARVHHSAARAAEYGIRVGDITVDFPAVMGRVHAVIESIAGYEDQAHLESSGIAVRRGHAELAADGTVSVDGEGLTTEAVVIATGSHPAAPPVPGLDGVPYLTNETLFALTEQPRHMVVLGAGPIGLEMAQAFARLGTVVEVVDVVKDHLPREDPDVARLSQQLLEREGVRFTLDARTSRVTHDGSSFELTMEASGQERVMTCDALLVATGRRPNVDRLNLEDAGVRVTRTGIAVDEHLRTSRSSVFAAGDVTGILPFTHAAAYQGRLAARNALGRRASANYRVVPWVIFTDPEIAHVGMTEPEARERHGRDVHVAMLPFTAIDRAVISGEPEGLIKVITKGNPVIGHAGGGAVLGAHIIGPGAGELIHEFVVAMQVRAFSGRLAQAIHAYPSMSIGVQQAAAQLFAAGRATAGEMREGLSELQRG
jgi:pyruvate/2-oxoglutarate dehydrogenase complex dihydrolipoamide dehydrogenase (E3) component